MLTVLHFPLYCTSSAHVDDFGLMCSHRWVLRVTVFWRMQVNTPQTSRHHKI